MKFDSSVREKFEDEAPPTAHLSYRILEQADYSAVSGLSYLEY